MAGGRRVGGRRDGRVRAGDEGRDVDPPRDAPVAPRGRLGSGSRATNRITAENRRHSDDRVRIGFAAVAAEVDGSEQAPDLPKADRVDATASHLGQRLRADPDWVCRPNLASLNRPSSRASGPRVPTATRDLRFDRIGPERPGRLTGSRRRKGIGGGIVVP